MHIDPDCPYLELELPFGLGPFISLGGQGFGYFRGERGWIDPKDHSFGLIIRAGASIHPCVTIDRGSWRHTRIGFEARLNAGSFIGHNVEIGDGFLLGVNSSISGSCEIGSLVEVWSHAYIAQRCQIGDGSIIGQGANVLKGTEIGKNEVWFGNPAEFQRMRNE